MVGICAGSSTSSTRSPNSAPRRSGSHRRSRTGRCRASTRGSVPVITATGSPTSPRSTRILATNEDMTELVSLAHARGMKVFFDIITNHTADVIAYAGGDYSYVPKSVRPYTDAAGNPFDDRDYAGGETFPELDVDTSFPKVPYFVNPSDATVKVPDWLNDRTLYHNRGDTSFVGENSEYGDFFGLDDLFTEQPRVVHGMTDIYKAWVAFGIDGFRVDTVKHVNNGVLAAVHRRAAGRGQAQRQRRLLRLRRGVRRRPRIHVAVHHRGHAAGHDRFRVPDQRGHLRPRRFGGRAARPVRAQPHVRHPRAAGRLLRRRAGLHRHRRRPRTPTPR
jgi:Alpha amylase, catalytic domain